MGGRTGKEEEVPALQRRKKKRKDLNDQAGKRNSKALSIQ